MKIQSLKYSAVAVAAIMAGVLPAAAQYDQDITVEGKYVPEYIGHDRIGMFPKPMKFDTQQSELSYYLKGVNADFTPQLVPLQATGWNTSRSFDRHRGYLDLGMGSWLNSTLSAGYRLVDTDHTVFGVRLQHNSTSLWKPEMPKGPDVKRSRYDETIGLYATRLFDNAGRLDAAVDYHLGYFNYYGAELLNHFAPADPGDGLPLTGNAPTQTLNDVSARVMWHSPAARDAFSWYAGASVRYFGYRSYYDYLARMDGKLTAYGNKGTRETNTALEAGFVFPTSGKSSIGLDFEGNLLTYAKPESGSGDALAVGPDNYGILYLTPYYKFTRSGIDIRLGAQVDLAFNAGPKGNRYSVFHIAPDVKFDFNAGPAAIYLYATGGTRLNTLASRYEWDYYQAPELQMTKPVYTPLDAKVGVTFGPFSGFHAGLEVAYRASRGEYVGGWYMAELNGYALAPGLLGLPAEIDGNRVGYDLSSDVRLDMRGLSFGLNLGYDAGRYFKIDATARYQRQHGKTGYFNGYDRPEWTVDATAESNPWNTLKFKLGYSLRAMRNMTAPAYWSDAASLGGFFFEDYRLPNKSMLNFGVSYGITEDFDVWVQADNLLNRKNVYLPCLPEPGIALSAGIAVRF